MQNSKLFRRSSLLALFCFLALPCLVRAQENAPPPNPCAATDQPSDISLHISLASGQSSFRVGEIIPITAEYTSASAGKYLVSNRNYDRSGRLDGHEIFCITPSVATDPLDDYYNSGSVFIGGGLSSEDDLGKHPFTVGLELNEWMTLPPGHYSLRIASGRASTFLSPGSYRAGEPVDVLSNEIEFEVSAATSVWQAQTFAAAVAALNSEDPASDEAKQAARTLRFLGTEEATREMARRYWSANDQPNGWNFRFGLYGSKFRAAAIEQMKAELRAPEHPVTEESAYVLADLQLLADPKYKLPPYDAKNEVEWGALQQQRMDARDKFADDAMTEAAAAAGAKVGAARGLTVASVLGWRGSANPAIHAQMAALLLESWSALPAKTQTEMLEYRWDKISGPQWLPLLRAIVDAPRAAANSDDNEEPSRSLALRRIYQVSPSEGRKRILDEIENPKGGISATTLGMLSDKELPEMDGVLLAHLRKRQDGDTTGRLIARYASASIEKDVRATYGEHLGNWDCGTQASLLRYLIRVNSADAAGEVRATMAARQGTGCFQFMFTELGDAVAPPQIERIVIGALDDPVEMVERDAAQALQHYGSVDARPALWARLRKLHAARMDAPAADLPARPGEWSPQDALEDALVAALTQAHAWIADQQTIRAIENEVTGANARSQLEQLLQPSGNNQIGVVAVWSDGIFSYSVDRFDGHEVASLIEKLRQYPPGTSFDFTATGPELSAHASDLQTITDAASSAGLELHVESQQ